MVPTSSTQAQLQKSATSTQLLLGKNGTKNISLPDLVQTIFANNLNSADMRTGIFLPLFVAIASMTNALSLPTVTHGAVSEKRDKAMISLYLCTGAQWGGDCADMRYTVDDCRKTPSNLTTRKSRN